MTWTQHDCAGHRQAGSIVLRKRIRSALASIDFEKALDELGLPPSKLINPLLSFLYETDEPIRWRAVRAVGITVARMAENVPEEARRIMRRLMWSLNDESGGIGWGAPEAMGEIMAESELLAGEYYRILISYVDEEGNLLEHDALEKGALWGIGRLARVRPELVQPWIHVILKQLRSADPSRRALGLRIIASLMPGGASAPMISSLTRDDSEVRIYDDGEFKTFRVLDLASKVLERVGNPAA